MFFLFWRYAKQHFYLNSLCIILYKTTVSKIPFDCTEVEINQVYWSTISARIVIQKLWVQRHT